MIDILKARQYYKEYISHYNPQDSKIALKIAHINRTAEKAKWLAEKLQLSQEDMMLAELIGLLHDIGRFEQIKRYHTFVDKDSINHGEYSVKILFEDHLIRNFIEDNRYDAIIRKAILNHNKDKIENIQDDRQRMHCKVIRDADKLDIFQVILDEKLNTTYPLERYPREGVSKEILDDFITQHVIDYTKRATCVDILVSHMAYVFDINYLYTLREIKEKEYIGRIIKKFNPQKEETIQDLNRLKEVANSYMDEKIEEGKICLKNY